MCSFFPGREEINTCHMIFINWIVATAYAVSLNSSGKFSLCIPQAFKLKGHFTAVLLLYSQNSSEPSVVMEGVATS